MARRTTGAQQRQATGILAFLRGNWLNALLVFVPISLAAAGLHASHLWLFLTAALALIPLAGLIGAATEELSLRVGPIYSGLLNATVGNAPELIIGIFALREGLTELVKASISGSLIGNILLVLGLSMLIGGWNREKQVFNRTSAGASAAMLFLAVVALVMPAVFVLTVGHAAATPPIDRLSLLIACVLLCIYVASLVFSLKTHRALFSMKEDGTVIPRLSTAQAAGVLGIAALATAVEAELLVGTVAEAAHALGMTNFFVGVIIVAIVGNAAEHVSALQMGRKNHMDLAVTICTGSSTQVALFVAPVLVIVSFLIGKPMSLLFNPFEIVGIALSVLAVTVVTLDGESNWFEGLQLTAVYVVLAIVFYFVPGK